MLFIQQNAFENVSCKIAVGTTILWITVCATTTHIRASAWKKHDDVIKWTHFPRYWPFVRGIHRSPVNSPHKGQWRGALMFTLICVWINGWVNNRKAGDLRRNRAHYDVTVMNSGWVTISRKDQAQYCTRSDTYGDYTSTKTIAFYHYIENFTGSYSRSYLYTLSGLLFFKMNVICYNIVEKLGAWYKISIDDMWWGKVCTMKQWFEEQMSPASSDMNSVRDGSDNVNPTTTDNPTGFPTSLDRDLSRQ